MKKITLREGLQHQLKLGDIQQGIYIYRLLNTNEVLESGKLIIN